MKLRLLRMALTLALIAVVAAGALANVDVVRIRVNTAMRYISMGWLSEAEEHVTEAVKVAPQNAEAAMLLALLQHGNGRGEAALWQYDLTMQLDPDMAVLAVFMGDIHLAAGRPDEAAALYSKALAADAHLGLAHYGLGRAFELKSAEGDALDAYAQGVQFAPDMTDLRFRLGTLLRRDGQFDEALEHLLHASRVDSNLAHVRYELGLTYEALERFAAAEHEYRTVLRLHPDHESARRRLAELSVL